MPTIAELYTDFTAKRAEQAAAEDAAELALKTLRQRVDAAVDSLVAGLDDDAKVRVLERAKQRAEALLTGRG